MFISYATLCHSMPIVINKFYLTSLITKGKKKRAEAYYYIYSGIESVVWKYVDALLSVRDFFTMIGESKRAEGSPDVK